MSKPTSLYKHAAIGGDNVITRLAVLSRSHRAGRRGVGAFVLADHAPQER